MAKRAFETAFAFYNENPVFESLREQQNHSESLAASGVDSPNSPRRSWFTAMKSWATAAVAAANPFTLRQRVTTHYARAQQILAIPICDSPATLKKRLVDAFSIENIARSDWARAARPRPRRQDSSLLTRLLQRRASRSPPTTPPRTQQLNNSPHLQVAPLVWNITTPPCTPLVNQDSPSNITLHEDVFMDDEDDISLDFSFSDILTSTPTHGIDARSSSTTRSPTPSPSQPNNPPSELSPINWTSPSIYASASPSTFNTTASPVTPNRDNLLKQQLRRSAELSDIEEETSFEIANESVHATQSPLADPPSSPFEADIESPLQSDAGSSPLQSNTSSSPFQSDVGSSPFQSDVGPPTAAHGEAYENDLLFLNDASTLPLRKAVRWAQHVRAKPFYYDEGVSEMLDSTLETINSSLEESEMSMELQEELEHEADSQVSLGVPAPVLQQGLVSPLDTPEMDFLENMAEATDYGKDTDYSIVDDKLKARDFATLLPSMFNGDPKAWINDNIVNEYLSILVNYKKRDAGFEHKRGGPAPPVHAFSSFWYTGAKKDVQSVGRWAARFQLAGPQYLDAQLLLYPICDAGHWRLLAVKPQERNIEYLDSLGFNGKPYTAKILEYLKMELKDAFIAEEWTVVEKQRSSRQLNGSDCGVFTLLNALALLRGEEVDKVIACDGMIDARERIATTLMAGVPTTEME
ncbi:cysteine proteinase [Plenodomus tracheiphilus IPT5]|uniref:Cysteine proteinase n=1 Tax=Plenodomus tracheiphilus IPT5 TaxID=1408161 RepID=A0A6A7BJR6_9PLEO|nr:cysteine proteinase [Plenodomus tracheiphilus IPT5]